MAREPLHPPVHGKPLHDQPIQAHQQPDYDNMSDQELAAFVASQEGGNRYEIPPGMEPDGVTYQWKCVAVLGQPNYSNQALMEQKGWNAVPQTRHDGRWMPHNTQGPVIVDGLMLMEISSRLLKAKERYRDRTAREPVDGINERLSSPSQRANVAPRTEAYARSTPFAGPVEYSVEP